mgnify:CR=1 FL=1
MLLFIIPLVSIVFLLCVFIYTKQDTGTRKKKTNGTSNNVDNKSGNEVSANEIKNMLGIEPIRNGIIKTKNGDLRAILSISTPDFELLTDSEQGAFEDNLMSFGLSLYSSIMFFTTQQRARIEKPIKNINSLIDSKDETIPKELKEDASNYAASLEAMDKQKGNYVRKSYCVVGVTGSEENFNYKKMADELENRIAKIQFGIGQAGGSAIVLPSEQIAQVLTDVLNKGKDTNITQLQKDGVFELYTEGCGSFVYKEAKPEKTENN